MDYIGQHTVDVLDYNQFEYALKAINRKAKLFDLNPVTAVLRAQKTIPDVTAPWRNFLQWHYRVTINISLPPITDWAIAGIVNHEKKVVEVFPGRVIPDRYRPENAAPYCEHCGLPRKRSEIYVLMRGKPEVGLVYMGVGRLCLKDFEGTDAARTLEMFQQLRFPYRIFDRDHIVESYDLEAYLASVIIATDMYDLQNDAVYNLNDLGNVITGRVVSQVMPVRMIGSTDPLEVNARKAARDFVEQVRKTWDRQTTAMRRACDTGKVLVTDTGNVTRAYLAQNRNFI